MRLSNLLVHTRLRHFRDKSHAKSAATGGGEVNDLLRVMILPKMQLAYDRSPLRKHFTAYGPYLAFNALTIR